MQKTFATEQNDDNLIIWLWIETGIITNFPEDDYAVHPMEPEPDSETRQ